MKWPIIEEFFRFNDALIERIASRVRPSAPAFRPGHGAASVGRTRSLTGAGPG